MGNVQSIEGGVDSTNFSTNGWSGTYSWDSHLERLGLKGDGVLSITSLISGGLEEIFQ